MCENNRRAHLRAVPLAALFFVSVFLAGCLGGGGDSAGEAPGVPAAASVLKLFGICFSPFADGQAPGTKISEAQIAERLNFIKNYTQWVRTYGCSDGLELIGKKAHEIGLKAAIGAWLSADMAANEIQLTNLIQAAKNGHADIVIVGNEILSTANPALTEAALIDYIRRVKREVPAGVIVTCAEGAETFLAHPALVAEIDAVFANVYPFWGGVAIDAAVENLNATYWKLKAASGSKTVYISETGWPDAGSANGAAVPSPENAAYYLKSFTAWASANGVPCFYFSAFDEKWKAVAETGSVGSHWGLFNSGGAIKPLVGEVLVKKSWSASLKNGILEIAYGGGADYRQYAALHLDGSYYRPIYGPESGFGVSAILCPSFWRKGTLYQGCRITATWAVSGDNFTVDFSGGTGELNFTGKLTLAPPSPDYFATKISVAASGNMNVDARPGEAFQYIKLSSMHVSDSSWDSQKAFAGPLTFSLPKGGRIVDPAVSADYFGLTGGTSSWKANSPTIVVLPSSTARVTGWVTESGDPNDDNVGYWAADDRALPSCEYTIVARP